MLNQLKKWIRGDVDLKEEQQLLQQGKTDEFLRDAMEGYQSMPAADHEETIKMLKSTLRDRYKKKETKKRGGIHWSTIASAAAFIGAIAIFFWTQRELPGTGPMVEAREAPSSIEKEEKVTEKVLDNTVSSSLSDKESTRVGAIGELSESEAPKPEARVDKPSKDRKKLKVDPSNIEAGVIAEDDLQETAADYAGGIQSVPEASNYAIEQETDEVDIAIAEEKNVAPISLPPAAAAMEEPKVERTEAIVVEKENDYAEAKKETVDEVRKEAQSQADYIVADEATKVANLNALNGSVIDLSLNEALIGVNVLVKGTNDGTLTDIDGRFTINSSKELPWVLVVSYIGFNTQEITVNNFDEELQVVLDESGAELSEVVVTGYTTKAKRSTSKALQSKNKVRPAVSSKKMKRYIRKNLKYPQSAKDQKVEGTVTVRFFINSQGQAEQLSIMNSLETACDQEAIRLIEEGPKWKPTNRWATYTIEFKL